MTDPRSQYRFSDYAKALREHYREFATDNESIRYIENVAASCEALQPRPDRFQPIEQRNFGSSMNAWHACRGVAILCPIRSTRFPVSVLAM
jgi:hypothetical protein